MFNSKKVHVTPRKVYVWVRGGRETWSLFFFLRIWAPEWDVKNQIGPPHFLFWSFNQPPWWIMGNVWSGPCDPLSFTCQLFCSYNWNWDIGKQVNAAFHWAAKWGKTHAKPHQPSSLRLRWLGCPAAGECGRTHWWTRGRNCSVVGKSQRRGNDFFFLSLLTLKLHSYLFLKSKSRNCCNNFPFGNKSKAITYTIKRKRRTRL